MWSLGHWVFWVIHYKNDRSFGFDHDHSRILCIHWVIWYFWPKWNVFWINYFLGLLVILEMLKYSSQFVTFKVSGHRVIWCFRSLCFFWNEVFGHWVIQCFSQSFEEKLQTPSLQPAILQPPSLQLSNLQSPNLQDSQQLHLINCGWRTLPADLTYPNIRIVNTC